MCGSKMLYCGPLASSLPELHGSTADWGALCSAPMQSTAQQGAGPCLVKVCRDGGIDPIAHVPDGHGGPSQKQQTPPDIVPDHHSRLESLGVEFQHLQDVQPHSFGS